MITTEELKKFTKLVSQDAWKQEMNTTLNDMVEYICFRVSEKLLEEFTAETQRLMLSMDSCLVEHDESLLSNILNKLDELDLRTKDLKDGSKDGGVSKSQRSKKAGA